MRQPFTFCKSRGWICAASIKTGHCALCSRDLNEWQVVSVCSAPVIVLSPTQLYEPRIEPTFTLGEKGLTSTRWPPFEMMVQPSFHYTVCPNKKETRFISRISSLPRKIYSNYMLHYQGHFLFFHLIPNTWWYLNAWLKRNNLNSCMSKSICAE